MIVIVSPPAASETTADAFCLRARIPTTDMCSIEVHVDTILTVSRGAPRWSPNGWASGSELHPCAPSGLAGSSRRPTTSPRGFGTSALTNATSATTTPSKASLRDPRSTDPVGSVQQRRGLVVHQRGQDAGNCSAPVQTQVMNRVAAVDIRRLWSRASSWRCAQHAATGATEQRRRRHPDGLRALRVRVPTRASARARR